MPDRSCTRCGAYLKDGYCEYCGWNCPDRIPDKTLTLSGLRRTLTVTRETSTFAPKAGSPLIINNREIAQVSITQAQAAGTGELMLSTVTGISQKITFSFSQNQNMNEIASYLLHVAPDARFGSSSTLTGVTCPKCRSNNTQSTGETRKMKIWAMLVGLLFLVTGFTLYGEGVAAMMTSFVIGGVLTAFGFGLLNKKKTDCLCLACRAKFRL